MQYFALSMYISLKYCYNFVGIDCRYDESMHDCLNYLFLGQLDRHRQDLIR